MSIMECAGVAAMWATWSGKDNVGTCCCKTLWIQSCRGIVSLLQSSFPQSCLLLGDSYNPFGSDAAKQVSHVGPDVQSDQCK